MDATNGQTAAVPQSSCGTGAGGGRPRRHAYFAAEVMDRYNIPKDDLFTAMTPHLAKLQNPNDVHFTGEGYDFLGARVAESIEGALKK